MGYRDKLRTPDGGIDNDVKRRLIKMLKFKLSSGLWYSGLYGSKSVYYWKPV